jgi:hypothetical protein
MKLAIKLKEMNATFAKWVSYPTFPGKVDPYCLFFLFKLQRIRMFLFSLIECYEPEIRFPKEEHFKYEI